MEIQNEIKKLEEQLKTLKEISVKRDDTKERILRGIVEVLDRELKMGEINTEINMEQTTKKMPYSVKNLSQYVINKMEIGKEYSAKAVRLIVQQQYPNIDGKNIGTFLNSMGHLKPNIINMRAATPQDNLPISRRGITRIYRRLV